MPCALSGGYQYVFVGSILSSTPVSDFDFRLQLKPEEVFLGNPAAELMVTTDQGACFGDFHPGDEWLFYVDRDEKTGELSLNYYAGSLSRPAKDAQTEIEFVRRQSRMDGAGLIKGYVSHEAGPSGPSRPVQTSSQWMVATRISDGGTFYAVTDLDDEYVLGPLPEGAYKVTAEAAEGERAGVAFFGDESEVVDVKSKSCTSVNFTVKPDNGTRGAESTDPAKLLTR
jgi:hypothetical protein